jgi:hypothetical protein
MQSCRDRGMTSSDSDLSPALAIGIFADCQTPASGWVGPVSGVLGFCRPDPSAAITISKTLSGFFSHCAGRLNISIPPYLWGQRISSSPKLSLQHARRNHSEGVISCWTFCCDISFHQLVLEGRSTGQPPIPFVSYYAVYLIDMCRICSSTPSRQWDFLTHFSRTSPLSSSTSMAFACSKKATKK